MLRWLIWLWTAAALGCDSDCLNFQAVDYSAFLSILHRTCHPQQARALEGVSGALRDPENFPPPYRIREFSRESANHCKGL